MAAAVAAVIVLAASVMIGADFLGVAHWVNPSFEETAVGQQRAIALGDGSLIQLNTATRLVVEFAPRARRISLDSGEARFTVAHDPNRPFIVTTPQASVRAIGTVFNVQTAASGTSVAVLQGHVEVSTHGTGTLVPAAARTAGKSKAGSGALVPQELDLFVGQRAAVSPTGRITFGAGPSLERVKGWVDGRLVFRNETLADLVAEFNRYHTHPLRIADPMLAGVRVSGTFAADDVPSLELFLERYEGVEVRTAPDGSALLERRTHR
jgi:transmembrane sensor